MSIQTIAIECGNKVCQVGETISSCPSDCKKITTNSLSYFSNGGFKDLFSSDSTQTIVLIIVFVLVIWYMKKKGVV